jgi:hypothetical protein
MISIYKVRFRNTDKYKAYKKKCNVVIRTAKSNYIQHIRTSSNNTPKINIERGSLNNTLTCNIHLQVENETVSGSSRTYNTFNITFLETINSYTTNFMHSQTSNNTI